MRLHSQTRQPCSPAQLPWWPVCNGRFETLPPDVLELQAKRGHHAAFVLSAVVALAAMAFPATPRGQKAIDVPSIKVLFDSIDPENSGSISLAEAAAFVKKAFSMGEEDIQQLLPIFHRADLSQDERFNYEEFAYMMKSIMPHLNL